ncbi:MAG TPA: carboxylesterase family protein [Terriglobales bacterium]|nr:carboxylesterase family protein [Terriglobales bacterium]
MGWRSVRTAICLICLQLGCIGTPVAQSEQQPIVKIQSGLLYGIHFGSNPSGAAFLGVPYAAPPIGELRWKPPQPAPKWSGTRKALNYGSPCPQLPARWFSYIEGNEDCLYLNIWTTDIRPTANRPVLVYFHGGSNTQGYSQMTPLGPPLSQMGLVVVSANYRLGPFGFLAHSALAAESEHHSSGNYGLLDQLQALRWVKENIRKFGGDPGRVTVMGQSAGAVDICLLMASPMSQGLFQGAILESGECQDTLNEDIRAPIRYNFIDTTGEASGERLARDRGVPSGPDTLRKLRQVPAKEILNAWKNDPGLHFDAIVDGWVVPKQPAQIFAEGKQMHIPILVGSNADEATVFGHNDLKTVGDYKKHLQQDTGQYWKEEFQLYPVSSDADVPTRSVRLESDEFACGAYSIAQAMTKAGEKSYLYYFTYVDPGKRSRLGAHHGEELFFLSDSFPADWEHTNEDKHLGELLRGYWAEFAKTGDPNSDGAPKWSAYESNSGEYFEIGAHVGLRPVSEGIRTMETTMRRIVSEQN